ncbi:hypothetical protein D3C73_1461500 [compost metagenome]
MQYRYAHKFLFAMHLHDSPHHLVCNRPIRIQALLGYSALFVQKYDVLLDAGKNNKLALKQFSIVLFVVYSIEIELKLTIDPL